MNDLKIILANPQGFCAGVERAIAIVERALELFSSPVYVYHEVVHNQFVIADLTRKGAIFVEDINDIPNGQVAIFSAHGVAKKIVEEAERRNLKIYDATCPLVTKVHKQAKVYYKKKIPTILIGHRNHPEVVGTMGQVPDGIFLVEKVEDLKQLKLKSDEKVAYITQTTLSLDETKEIIEAIYAQFKDVICAAKEDICYATENRQQAVKQIIDYADALLVVGSSNSSNSNRLKEIGQKHDKPSYLVDDPKSIKAEWFENIQTLALSAGASAPETLVQLIIAEIKKIKNTTVVKHDGIEEQVYFPILKELR